MTSTMIGKGPEHWVWDEDQYRYALEQEPTDVRVRVVCVKCLRDTNIANACPKCGRLICNDCATRPMAECYVCQAGTPTVPPI